MLGDQALVSLAADGDGAAPLSFSVLGRDTARRNGVTAGAAHRRIAAGGGHTPDAGQVAAPDPNDGDRE
ncbi:MAG: hypothetical protein MZW92_39510 [Comamonadaceae bacterium]|nr:hypothetical protein [Comamonadaceae bacterium]